MQTDPEEVRRFYGLFTEYFDDDTHYLRGAGDIAYYRSVARGVDTPILELGCGTGRITIPLALDGHRVDAIDLSPEMVQVLRDKLASQPGALVERVALQLADMREFSSERRYGLIVCPFRGFQHLLDRADQQRVLSQVRSMLAANGRFVFDLFNPTYRFLADPPRYHSSIERVDERTGKRLIRIDTLSPNYELQILRAEMCWYEVLKDGGRRKLPSVPVHLRWIHRFELELLLQSAGLEITALYGGFERQPFDRDASEMVVECALIQTAP